MDENVMPSMRFALYLLLLFFALAGTARVGLFALNRAVFGRKTEDETLMKRLIVLLPPLFLALSLTWIPLYHALEHGRPSWLALPGAVWLAVSVCTGVYWVVDRSWRNLHPRRVEGVVTTRAVTVKLRKAHIPFRSLRRLGAHNDLYDLELTTHEVGVEGLPPEFDGYRIAFMTDTHVAGFMRRGFYRRCLEEIRHFGADLVIFGGDFVTWSRHIPLMAELLTRELEPPDGAWAVLGNHDYWADADSVVAALTARGVRFVVNRSTRIRRGGAELQLVGIDEVYRGHPDVAAAFAGVDDSKPVIGVSHHPDIIGLLGNRRLDLLVCGHTHGGQIRFPFFGAVVVPSKHEGRYAAGFYRQERVLMYVSRGLGAVPPLRILCKPELPLFLLRPAAKVKGRWTES